MTTAVHSPNLTVKAMERMAIHTDTLNKTVKTAEQGVNLAKIIAGLVPGGQGVATGLGLLSGTLKTTKSVITATNIFERAADWGTKKTRDAILTSWQKTASRVALTCAQLLETVSFVDKCMNGFFYQASFMVCHLPVLDVVKNCLYMISAGFGLFCSGRDMSKALSTIPKAQEKSRKWTEFDETDIASTDALYGDYTRKLNEQGATSRDLSAEIGVLDTIIRKNQDKLPTLSAEDVKPVKSEIKTDSAKLSALKTKLVSVQKYERYLDAMDSKNVKSIKNYKIEKYATREKNSLKLREKSWIAIVVDVGKIVMISLGMAIVALSPVFPVLTLPATAIVVTSLSLISNAFGLTKNLYGSLAPKPVKEPVFVASAA